MITDRRLAVAYRVYPGISDIPSKKPVIFPKDKFNLFKTCCKSFKQALGEVEVKVWFILDSCPDEYEHWIQKTFDESAIEILRLEGAGNEKTFEKQISILINQNFSDNIYFAEDDYLYTKGSIEKGLDFLSQGYADVISLYDNPDYYMQRMHKYKRNYQLEINQTWKTVSNTTLTFMTSKNVLEQIKCTLQTFSRKNNDSSIWMSLTKIGLLDFNSIYRFVRGKDNDLKKILKAYYFSSKKILFHKKIKLMVPTPSLATHIETNSIAPLFNIEKYLDS